MHIKSHTRQKFALKKTNRLHLLDSYSNMETVAGTAFVPIIPLHGKSSLTENACAEKEKEKKKLNSFETRCKPQALP